MLRVLGGVVCASAGAVLLYQSLATYDARLKARVSGAAATPSARASSTGFPNLIPASPDPRMGRRLPVEPVASLAPPPPSASASSSVAPPAISASPPPSGSATTASPGDVFHFGAGGIILPKDELAKLVAFGGAPRKQDRPRIVIEGFGDVPGSGDTGTFLGRRRAMIVRQLFGDIGIDSERVTLLPVDVAEEPALAGAVRIRPTTPPEVKSP